VDLKQGHWGDNSRSLEGNYPHGNHILWGGNRGSDTVGTGDWDVTLRVIIKVIVYLLSQWGRG